MKRFTVRLLNLVCAGLLIVATLLVAHRTLYFSQYNGLLREIWQQPGLEVVDAWQHRDTILEDFGFAIKSPAGVAEFGIHFTSRPSHTLGRIFFLSRPLDGVYVHVSHREGFSGEGHRYVSFKSPEWTDRGLPAVRTLADVVAHFDRIAPVLLSQPPATLKPWGGGHRVTIGRSEGFFRTPADRYKPGIL